jgi:outer membrane receptor for ferric coprogen and ferric-rhodotorulic acid
MREYATNQSYGAVLRLLSWVSASAGYFQSSLFNDHPNDYGIALQGEPFGPRVGRGQDYSLRFNALNDRLYATATYYRTSAKNNFQNVSAATIKELNGLLSPTGPLAIIGNKDSTDQDSHGFEFELVGNPTPNWTVRATFADNHTNPIVSFPRLNQLLVQAEAIAKSKGLDPNVATATTQAFMAGIDGTTATFRPRERSASLTTRYIFTEGKLRGLLIGTSMRYRMGFPVTAQLQVGGMNVLNPYNTPDDLVVNPFVAYTRKFGWQKWELRLTANNVFDRVSNQGNNPNVPRYTEPRRVIGSATLAF